MSEIRTHSQHAATIVMDSGIQFHIRIVGDTVKILKRKSNATAEMDINFSRELELITIK